MVQRHRHHGNRYKPRTGAPAATVVRAPSPSLERKAPVKYGKPFVLLEDGQKSTFIYSDGQWVAHAASIAQCRQDCQVKELPQKINGMTRYEVCSPLPTSG